MLYALTQWLVHYDHHFDLFQYLTLRTILSTLTALILSLCLGPRFIRYLTRSQLGQVVRTDGPSSHQVKTGTPTMGGGLILITILLSTLLWGDLTDHYVWLVMLAITAFGVIGWWDDYLKISRRNSKGLSAKKKYLWQSGAALLIVLPLYFTAKLPAETALIIPFFKHTLFYLGPFFILFAYLVIVGTSNSVNLTDGLDGLAIVPTIMIGAGLGIFAYIVGNHDFAHYLLYPYIPGTGEVAVVCGAIIGSGLGFLWFNTYPAQIFMGDIGSLGLGAALGTIAIILRQEIILFIMGGVFVIEAISVILQVGSFKLTGHRIFRMAPLHHHFELKGWPEPRVIVRFWIITFILVLIGLATLKIR